MQKNDSNRHLKNITMTKDLLVAPPKIACLGTLLRNPDLDIDKMVIKIKKLSSY